MAQKADVISIQSHDGLYLRCSSSTNDTADRAIRRNSMAIRHMLNPSDQDDNKVGPQSPSNPACSSKVSTAVAPASTQITHTPELTDHGSRSLTPASTPASHTSEQANHRSWDMTPASTPASHTPELADHWSRGSTPALAPARPINEGRKADRGQRDLGSRETGSQSDEDVPVRKQDYRFPYDEEQDMFIWFFTTDVELYRPLLVEKYNEQWPGAQRNKVGIECRLYRLPDIYDFPKRRGQKGPGGKIDSRQYGMWPKKGRSYKWMDEYADRLPGESTLCKMDTFSESHEIRLCSRGSLLRT